MKPKVDRPGVVTMASSLGRKKHQEDRAGYFWVESPSLPAAAGWLLTVFDGHGGHDTADIASKSFPSLFEKHFQAQRGRAAESLRDAMISLTGMTRQQRSGSTASVVFIPKDTQTATVAVLGDSPIAVLDAQGCIHIGPDHNIRANKEELAAAETRGGVFRDGYLEERGRPGVGIQFARSLGDVALANVLRRDPEIKTFPLGPHGIVLVGSDGLFSPGATSEQLKRFIGLLMQGADAAALVADAEARQTGDNVTAIVWKGSGAGGSR